MPYFLVTLFVLKCKEYFPLENIFIVMFILWSTIVYLKNEFEKYQLKEISYRKKLFGLINSEKVMIRKGNAFNEKFKKHLQFVENKIAKLMIYLPKKCACNKKQKVPEISEGNRYSGCNNSERIFMNGKSKSEHKNVYKVYKLGIINAKSVLKFSKICFEHRCMNIMISNEPILTNLCPICKPIKGKSIDFYQFLTRSDGRVQYFCGCQDCRSGNTASCLEKYCSLCTMPKYVN